MANEYDEAHLDFAYEIKALVDTGDITIPAHQWHAIAAHERVCRVRAELAREVRARIEKLTAMRRKRKTMAKNAGQEYEYAHTDLGVAVRTAVMSGRMAIPIVEAQIAAALQRACDAHDALITQLANEAGVLALGGGRYDARQLLPRECAS